MHNPVIFEVGKQFLSKRDGAGGVSNAHRDAVTKRSCVDDVAQCRLFNCVIDAGLEGHGFHELLIFIGGALLQLDRSFVPGADKIFEEPEIVGAMNRLDAKVGV